MRLGNLGQFLHVPCIGIDAVVGTDGSFGDGQAWIEHQIRIDFQPRAQTGTDRTGALRRVETEKTRLQLGDVLARVIDAGIPLGIYGRLLFVDIKQLDDTIADGQRLFDGLGHTRLQRGVHRQAVDDDLDVMFVFLVERREFVQRIDDAVDAGTGETLTAILLGNMGELALFVFHDRREDQQFRAASDLHDFVDDGLGRPAVDGLAADRTVRYADTGEQQTQIIIDLGDRGDRRARVARRRLLVDGNRRAEAVDLIDVRLFHQSQELSGIAGKALDVASLPLGIDGIEGQTGLTRPAQSGNHHELVARYLNTDILQVVFPSSDDLQYIRHNTQLYHFFAGLDHPATLTETITTLMIAYF